MKSGGKTALVVWSVGNFINHEKHRDAATGTSGMLMFQVGMRDDGASSSGLEVQCYQFQPFCMTPDFHLHATNLSDPNDPCLADAEIIARFELIFLYH